MKYCCIDIDEFNLREREREQLMQTRFSLEFSSHKINDQVGKEEVQFAISSPKFISSLKRMKLHFIRNWQVYVYSWKRVKIHWFLKATQGEKRGWHGKPVTLILENLN